MTCSKAGACADPVCPTKISYITTICQTLIPFFNISPEVCAMGAFGISIGSTYFFMPTANKKIDSTSRIKFEYKPSTGNPTNSFYIVDSAEKMIGDSDLNNLMVTNEDTKHIWAKNIAIIDLTESKSNEVNIYYSLCSTKITDGNVGTIKGFNKELHKVNFFCSINSPSSEEFFINHKNFNDQPHTCFEVRKDTAVCVAGNADIDTSYIGITNKTYVDSVFTDAII
jgi:hypothetical protein